MDLGAFVDEVGRDGVLGFDSGEAADGFEEEGEGEVVGVEEEAAEAVVEVEGLEGGDGEGVGADDDVEEGEGRGGGGVEEGASEVEGAPWREGG